MKDKPVFKSAEGREAILKVYDTVLEKWPVPMEKLTLKTSHGDTFVIACGDESLQPLILIHGSSSNSAMWIGEIAEYCRFYRTYAVDIPGESGKSSDSRFDLRTADGAEWLSEVFYALGIDRASITGISLGAWMALKFAAAFPCRVDKLVLLCPSGIGPQKASFMLYILAAMLFSRKGLDKVARKIYGSDDIPPEALEYSSLIGKNFNPYVGVIPIFSDMELKRLNMPLLLIAGRKDVLLNSDRTAARLARLLPEAKICLLPDTGHVLINQAGKIIAFLLDKKA